LYLWLGGLAFHWALFVILFRHLRFLRACSIIGQPCPNARWHPPIPVLFFCHRCRHSDRSYLSLCSKGEDPQLRYLRFLDYFALPFTGCCYLRSSCAWSTG
jgi:hypothetical protein